MLQASTNGKKSVLSILLQNGGMSVGAPLPAYIAVAGDVTSRETLVSRDTLETNDVTAPI